MTEGQWRGRWWRRRRDRTRGRHRRSRVPRPPQAFRFRRWRPGDEATSPKKVRWLYYQSTCLLFFNSFYLSVLFVVSHMLMLAMAEGPTCWLWRRDNDEEDGGGDSDVNGHQDFDLSLTWWLWRRDNDEEDGGGDSDVNGHQDFDLTLTWWLWRRDNDEEDGGGDSDVNGHQDFDLSLTCYIFYILSSSITNSEALEIIIFSIYFPVQSQIRRIFLRFRSLPLKLGLKFFGCKINVLSIRVRVIFFNCFFL